VSVGGFYSDSPTVLPVPVKRSAVKVFTVHTIVCRSLTPARAVCIDDLRSCHELQFILMPAQRRRTGAYESPVKAEEGPTTASRSADAMKITIRNLHALNPALQSTAWFEQVDSVLELSSPSEAANFLVTEDKMTTALEILRAYSQHRYSPSVVVTGSAKEAWLKSVASTPADFANTGQLERRVVAFEQALGSMLLVVLEDEHTRSESLIVSGFIHELIRSAKELLMSCAIAPSGLVEMDRTQPALILRYVSAVIGHLSESELEDHLMPMILEYQLVPTVVEFLAVHGHLMSPTDLHAALDVLAKMLGTESALDQPRAYLPPACQQMMASSLEAFLSDLPAETKRKLYLPLVDAMQGYGAFRYTSL